MCLLSFLKWGYIGYYLGIVQWDFTRRDQPGNPGRYPGQVLSHTLPSNNGIFFSSIFKSLVNREINLSKIPKFQTFHLIIDRFINESKEAIK